jgi:uncharacterized protein HemX
MLAEVAQTVDAVGPIAQYGALGLCGVMMAGFFALGKSGLRVWAQSSKGQREAAEAMRVQLETTTNVITRNTAVIDALSASIRGQERESRRLSEELVRRPCMRGVSSVQADEG